MIYVLFWILNDYIRLNIFPSSQDWLEIDVMVTLVAETNEYANIFHGSIQWLPLPNFHRPKLTHQNLSPRSLLPLGSLLVVRDQGSQVVLRFRSIKRSCCLCICFITVGVPFARRAVTAAKCLFIAHICHSCCPPQSTSPFAPGPFRRRRHFVASQKLRKY